MNTAPQFSLFKSPPERREHLDRRFLREAWPMMRRLARLHRRTFIRDTRIVVVVGTYAKTTTYRAAATALGLGVRPPPWRNMTSYIALNMLRIRPGQKHAVIEVGIGGPEEGGLRVTGAARCHRRDFHRAGSSQLPQEHGEHRAREGVDGARTDLLRNRDPQRG